MVQFHQFGMLRYLTLCNNAHSLAKLYSAVKTASLIETGMKLHALLPFEGGGEGEGVVEVLLDMRMTDGPTGIGIGIAQGVMRMTMVLDGVVAADPTMIGSIAAGRAVITMHLKIIIRYLPSNSILSLLRLHL
jgi:hypothetical protein